jgi:hypothetical protein
VTTNTLQPSAPTRTDRAWLRLVQVAVAVGVVSLLLFAYVGTFFTTIGDGGDFKYTADYWYTGVGVPIALVGIGLTLGVHRLQHGADGRLGTVGVWVNTVALSLLIVQLGASVLAGAELQWGPTYLLGTFGTFVGVALLAAGSWQTGLLPKWMLSLWPVVWVLGTFLAQGPTPLLLAAFLVVLGLRVTRQVQLVPGH